MATNTTNTIYHHTDHLTGGSVDTDQGGYLLQVQEYLPFGSTRVDERFQSYANNKKFTGKELDTESGLYYYGARYYDAEIGRFMSHDIWFGDLRFPQTLNKYTYTLNNPLKFRDPTGNVPDITDSACALAGPAAPACLIAKEAVEGVLIGAFFLYKATQANPNIETSQIQDAVESSDISENPNTSSDNSTSTEPSGNNPDISNNPNNGGNNSPFLKPENLIPGTPVIQQLVDPNNMEQRAAGSRAVIQWFADRGITVIRHAADRIAGFKLGNLGVTPQNVFDAIQNGRLYSDMSYPSTINRIIEFGNGFLRVAADKVTNSIITVVVENNLDPQRFIPVIQ